MALALQVKDMYAVDFIREFKATKSEIEQAKDFYEEFKAYDGCESGDEYDFVDYLLEDIGMNDLIGFENE